VIKYGSVLHIDCHLTVPWYLSVRESHDEIEAMGILIKKEFVDSVEIFVHTDPCLDFSCRICQKQDCSVRKFDFVRRIEWNLGNVIRDSKHGVSPEQAVS